jgi:hypothetical protein
MDEASARMLTSLNRPGGAVAQLGARLDGIEEVVGSNPIGSTKRMSFQHPSTKIEASQIIFHKTTRPGVFADPLK